MINEACIAKVFVVYGGADNRTRATDVYQRVVAHLIDLDVVPDLLAYRDEKSFKEFRGFARRHKLLEKRCFEGVKHITILKSEQGGTYPANEWSQYAAIQYATHYLQLGFVPELLPAEAKRIPEICAELAELLQPRYGIIFGQEMRFAPSYYAIGGVIWGPTKPLRTRDHDQNVHKWNRHFEKNLDAGLLRDVYPRNFLGKPHLDAPVGYSGQSLRQWIEADPEKRGELSPFTEMLTEWAPPIERIPLIREALFQAGRLFYWRFFEEIRRNNYEREPEPFYRPDLFQPWESPEPIPEMFTAKFYEDKDPGLTY